MRRNKIQKLLKKQAEISRQVMVLGTVLFAAGIMSVATIQIGKAATDADTNIAQNVSAGSLAITAPSQLNFNSGIVGETTNANITSSDYIIISDTRGNRDGWEVTGFFNTNFLKTGDTNVQMAINGQAAWFPGNMTVENNTGNNESVNKGTNANFAGINSENSLTLATSNNSHADNGAGSFNVYNLLFNYDIPIGAEATDYTTNLRLTIV